MTNPPIPPQVGIPASDSKPSAAPSAAVSLWARKPVLIVSLIVALIAGAIIGSIPNISTNHQLMRARAQLSAAHSTIDTAHATISSLRAGLAIAKNDAATAEAKAAAHYRADEARVTTTLKRLQTLEGKIQSTRLSADGVYVVGQDIKPGTYHTAGDGQTGGISCYYAVLNSTNTGDIADNNNFDGPETVTVTHGAFQIDGPCVWYRIG